MELKYCCPVLRALTFSQFLSLFRAFYHFFSILHIKRSYTVKKIGASLFLTFYHFLSILHMKLSYIYYSHARLMSAAYLPTIGRIFAIYPAYFRHMSAIYIISAIPNRQFFQIWDGSQIIINNVMSYPLYITRSSG